MQFAGSPRPRSQRDLIPNSLDDMVPTDHPVRLLDELLDRIHWSPFFERYARGHSGRPPIHPRILAGIWILAFLRKVRSSRQLEYQLQWNLEFQWMAHGHKIDHSTLAAFRSSNKDGIREANRQVISDAKALGVVRLGELYVDGTMIRANSSRHNTLTASKADKLLKLIESQIDEYLQRAEAMDVADDLFDDGVDGEKLPPELANLAERKKQLERLKQKCEDADKVRQTQGVNTAKNPFQLPVGDSDSRILPNKEGGYAPNYQPVCAVESEFGLIVAAEVLSDVAEKDALVGVVSSVQDNLGSVEVVCADTGFCTGHNINSLQEMEIEFYSPHRPSEVVKDNPAEREDPTQPVPESQWKQLPISPSTKRLSSAAFIYDEENNLYYCAMGRELHPKEKERRNLSNGEVVESERFRCVSCDDCPIFDLCRPEGAKTPRSVRRDQFASIREQHREQMETDEAKAANKRRSQAERPFAQIKEGFNMRRFQTRGTESVESEFGFAQLAHNLLRVLNTPTLLRTFLPPNAGPASD